jgi:MFS family permease
MSSVGKLPQSTALWIGTSCLAVFVLLLPLMGWLSDRLGRRPLLIASCIGYAVLGYPFFIGPRSVAAGVAAPLGLGLPKWATHENRSFQRSERN